MSCDTCSGNGHFTSGGVIEAPAPSVAAMASRWPRTAKVLEDYARTCLREGRPFFVSRYFNSSVLKPPAGFGFFAEIAAAAASAASAIGSVVGPAAQVAAAVNSINTAAHGLANTGGSSSSVTPDQIAAAILPNVQAQLAAKGLSLPADVAHQAVRASILDAFGPQYHNLVLAGGLGLAALVLFKLVRG